MMDTIKKFLSDHVRWEYFRDFFQIHILKYLVLWFSIVPLLAFILKDLPDQLAFTIKNEQYVFHLGLPFQWEILWLSSLAFILALGIYQFLCPAFIKKYHSYRHYSEYEHDGRWITREAAKFLKAASSERRRKFVDRLLTKKFMTKNENLVSHPLVDMPSRESYAIKKVTHSQKCRLWLVQFRLNGLGGALLRLSTERVLAN